MLKTLFFFELELDARVEHWSVASVSRHVLRILDALEQALRYRNLRSYFFPGHNVMLRKESAPEDYGVDAAILERFLRSLHATSLRDEPAPGMPERRWVRAHRRKVRQEERLIAAWLQLLHQQQQHQPPGQFSPQQISYLDELLQTVARSGGRPVTLTDAGAGDGDVNLVRGLWPLETSGCGQRRDILKDRR
ncbi:uncharacterized protein LOC119097921 [Pollicipes pollicipes]|uniref:uncharacterized protein LOC119097921 n=1 Tax=Pollicipes pollicipes TaxID=41117 RepID=UPI001884A104|nr:uncharacterized protein LOC119097921 [Pollicipes pollicipes]